MALTDASVQRVASGLNDGLQDGDLAIRVAAFADTPKAPPRHCSYCSWLRYVRIPCRSVDTCRYVADVSNCIWWYMMCGQQGPKALFSGLLNHQAKSPFENQTLQLTDATEWSLKNGGLIFYSWKTWEHPLQNSVFFVATSSLNGAISSWKTFGSEIPRHKLRSRELSVSILRDPRLGPVAVWGGTHVLWNPRPFLKQALCKTPKWMFTRHRVISNFQFPASWPIGSMLLVYMLT